MWESHADPGIRRVSKPGPEPIYLAYVVGDSDKGVEDIQVAAVTKPKSTPDQVEDFFRRLLASAAAPAPVPVPVPEVPVMQKLLQRLVAETQIRQPALVVASEPAGLEALLRSLLSGHLAPVQQPRQGSFRRDWNTVVCFSCGKAGHSATRCPTLDDTFPFMLPGWKAEKTPGGYVMIIRVHSQIKYMVAMILAINVFVQNVMKYATRISSKVRPQDPGGGGVQHGSPFPGKEWILR